MIGAWRKQALAAALAAAVLGLLLSAPGAAAANSLVVDDDKVQCPNAGNTDLDEAVFEAQSHDTIRICAGDYPVDSGTAPTTARCPLDAATTPNGLRLNKSLDIRGAGSSLVTVHPTRDLGDGNVRDFDGSVISVCASQPGSTSFQDVTVNISGVTVTDGGFNVDAGVNFYNSHGSVASSVVGPFSGPGLSYGIAATNGYSVSPAGAFARTVSVTGTRVFGYGLAGILADGSTGGNPPVGPQTVASGVATTVNVSASSVEGDADPLLTSQYGVWVNAGARALIQTSSISGNQAATAQNGIGVLLTNADTLGSTAIPPATPTASQYFTRIGNNNFAGNRYAVFNANADNTGVREAAPVQVTSGGSATTGNWYGAATGPVTPYGTESGPPVEGISGLDSTPALSVAPTASFWATTARTIPAVPSAVTDAAPTVEWGTPSAGDSLIGGEANELLVLAGDDFGVSSVNVTIEGVSQPPLITAPYALTYIPPTALIGSTITLDATATASNGATATTTLEVPVIAKPAAAPTPTAPPAEPAPEPPAKKCKKGSKRKKGKCVKKKKGKKK